jgi:predicted DCC family thiol-disulfide oxidoreductase YuxK
MWDMTLEPQTTAKIPAETAVLFNAACPVCNFEIQHYVSYAGAKGLPIRFDDLNSGALAQWDLTADQAARRLYVVHDGVLASGIEGFIILWRQMPRYHWLAKVIGLPVIKQASAVLYDYVAAPLIYRWHIRRQRRS